MDAALVYDGGEVIVPVGMGQPRIDQLLGTPLEQLGEVAGRICYDSLGQGRSSQEYHKHIIDVNNTSVYEHLVLTIGIRPNEKLKVLPALLNRKGVWIEFDHFGGIEITINYRAILEWRKNTLGPNLECGEEIVELLDEVFQYHGNQLAPMIVKAPDLKLYNELLLSSSVKEHNLSDDQAHITLWLYGSRGFTHEQVRHRFAISQRSTRYVDEDGSPYIIHPLIQKFLNARRDGPRNIPVRVNSSTEELNETEYAEQLMQEAIGADRRAYRALVNMLQKYCSEDLGLDKTSARKQARGAARGFLGNALASEMLYTTSIRGWKWILQNRKSKAADAEIRAIYTPALTALKASRYGSRFQNYNLIPSPDGIGEVLA